MMKSTNNTACCSSMASSSMASMTSRGKQEVFDLTLMKEKSLPVKTASMSNNSPPGLDDSSVSSLGSSTSGLYSTGSTSMARRSLFSKYWVKTGESPTAAHVVSAPPTAIIEIADDQLSQEESRNVDPMALPAQTVPPRRSLFSSSSFSSPSHHNDRRSVSLNCLVEDFELASISSPCNNMNSNNNGTLPFRHKSEGELTSSSKKPAASCLRESRFSFTKQPHCSGCSVTSTCEGNGAAAAGESSSNMMKRSGSICSEYSSCSVVQFDMESTEVRHFLKPAEVHAEDGWTNYFY